MSYVLIVLLSAYGSNGGNAMTSAAFPTREACEAAGNSAKTMGSYSREITFRCVVAY